ncbi:MAG: hypothetical protein EOO39_00595 [Cytophagaceae bacterium]|nr:MAG: hypothetical protein EOO39_00595 [Cytophagaceae bacterium]
MKKELIKAPTMRKFRRTRSRDMVEVQRRWKFFMKEARHTEIMARLFAENFDDDDEKLIQVIQNDPDFFGIQESTKPIWIADQAVRTGTYQHIRAQYSFLFGRWWRHSYPIIETDWNEPPYPTQKEWAAFRNLNKKWLSAHALYVFQYWNRQHELRNITTNTRIARQSFDK